MNREEAQGKRIFFYVQHLLGIGHLKRAATLARAMARAGLDVTIVSGGMAVPGLNIGGARLEQLPPVRATDLRFKQLVDENDHPIDDAWRQRRREALTDLWRRIDPHLLLFELFPFGRRQMRFELLPLLDAVTARTTRRAMVLSSVRDILVAQHKPERNLEMVERVQRYFDAVLVHGDPDFCPFERTFPHAREIADKLRYTGYVVDETGTAGTTADGNGEVIVSAGGGAVGLDLLRCAVQARPLSAARDLPWRVLAGVNVPEEDFAMLRRMADDGVIVERARSDFPALLAGARLSISQGGYNTMMEVQKAGIPALAVPYAGGIETEQTLRCRLLAERGALCLLDEEKLNPPALAAAIDEALTLQVPPAPVLDMNGAEKSAALIGAYARQAEWD